jgi:hypothetical protein
MSQCKWGYDRVGHLGRGKVYVKLFLQVHIISIFIKHFIKNNTTLSKIWEWQITFFISWLKKNPHNNQNIFQLLHNLKGLK